MIEYALLFALGFLTSALLALVIAPAIHRRIVAYTERRIYATMPISPEEVRAQKDMERAAFAAQTARVEQDLRRERESRLKAENLSLNATGEAARVASELTDLRNNIEEMNTAMADMRADVRRTGMHNADLKAALNLSQTTIDSLRKEIELHSERERRLENDISSARLDLAARSTENESLSLRLQAMRHERDSLNTDYRQSTTNLSDLERRIGQSESRLARLEQKTLRQAADLADMENALERKTREMERLRERLKDMTKQKEAYRKQLRDAGINAPPAEEPKAEPAERTPLMNERKKNAEALEKQGAALARRILGAHDRRSDAELRDEIADMAAAMAAFASQEGNTAAHLRDILVASTPDNTGHINLASRIQSAMANRDAPRR